MCFLFDWLIVKKRGVPLHEKQQMDDDKLYTKPAPLSFNQDNIEQRHGV